MSQEMYRAFSSGLLLCFGLYYLVAFLRGNRESCCKASSTILGTEEYSAITKRFSNSPIAESPSAKHVEASSQPTFEASNANRAAALSLLSLTTLSPCIGSMPVLLTLADPSRGAMPLLLAFAVLSLVTSFVMCVLVAISFLGAEKLDFVAIRRYERLIVGVGFIALAIITFSVLAKHDHHINGVHGVSDHVNAVEAAVGVGQDHENMRKIRQSCHRARMARR